MMSQRSSDFLKEHITKVTPLVQLVECRFPKPKVVGSSPTGRVYYIYILLLTGLEPVRVIHS